MPPVAEVIHPALEAAAAATGKPIPMHAVGMSATSIGVWAIFGMLVPVFVTGFVKLWPALSKLANERRSDLDDERRSDMADMRKELAEVRAEAREASERAHKAEIRQATLVAAVQLAMGELAKLAPPDSPVLKQVRELIAAATTDDMGFQRTLARIPEAIAERH